MQFVDGKLELIMLFENGKMLKFMARPWKLFIANYRGNAFYVNDTINAFRYISSNNNFPKVNVVRWPKNSAGVGWIVGG